MARLVSAWTDRNRVYLVQRIDDDIKIRSVPAKYSFFVSNLDENDQADLARDPSVSGVRQDGQYTRVDCYTSWARKELVEALRRVIDLNMSSSEIFEADVLPVRRLLSDVPSLEVDPHPRLVYLDIETDSRSRIVNTIEGNSRILSFALCDANGENVVAEILEADTDDSERELFRKLLTALKKYDCILAWYGSGFDFPVIQNRAQKLRVTDNGRGIIWHRWTWLDHLKVYKRHRSGGTGDEKSSDALAFVSKYLLGEDEGKLDFDSSKTWEAWAAGGESRQRLLEYNIQDAVLLPKIEAKTGYVDLQIAICNICRIFPDTESLRPTLQGDGFLLRLGDEHGLRWPTKPYVDSEDTEKFDGAYVMEPTRFGAVDDVHVCDFSGMYPSIMRTWNMSPDTKVERYGRYGPDEEITPEVAVGLCQLPKRTTWFQTDKPGMFRIALDRLVAKRTEYAVRMKRETPGSELHLKYKRLSQAFKVVANSFYGIIGTPSSRFFDVEIAEGVTQTGRFLIEAVIDVAKEHKLEPFYADTDGCFVIGNVDVFKDVVKVLNNSWSDMLKPWGIDKHYIDLDFEKMFFRIIMLSAKRYVGRYKMYKGKEVPGDAPFEIKGVEIARGDSVRLVRDFQMQIFNKLLEPDLPTSDVIRNLILDWKSRVYRGQLSIEDVVISKSLSRPIREYKDPLPPHVRVAIKLQEQGESIGEGSKIRYVVLPSEPGTSILNPVSIHEPGVLNKIDRVYYWMKKVYPPVQRILEKVYPDEVWSESTKERRARQYEAAGQQTLFDTVGSASTTGPRMRRRRKQINGFKIVLVEHSPLTDGGAEQAVRKRLLKAIHAVIDANPGDVSVTIIVQYKSYVSSEQWVKVRINVKEKIADTKKSRADLARIINGDNSFIFI